MTLEYVVKFLEGAFYVGSLAAFAAGLYRFRQNNREKKDQDAFTKYQELQDRYVKYLEICMEDPEISIGEYKYDSRDLSAGQKYKQMMLFHIFVSIIEEAYLLRNGMTESQWKGWDDYIKDYCSTPLFQTLWFDGGSPEIGWTNQFSGDFESYIEGVFVRIGILKANTSSQDIAKRRYWLPRLRFPNRPVRKL